MADATDPMQVILDLLSDNWKADNTNTITPKFEKITNWKVIDFNRSSYWILAHRPRYKVTEAGIGALAKRIETEIDLDVRVGGFKNEQKYLNILQEIERILDSKMIIPTGDENVYTDLNPDGEGPDLSDKSRGVFRQMMTVTLHNRLRIRGA